MIIIIIILHYSEVASPYPRTHSVKEKNMRTRTKETWEFDARD